MSAKVGFQDHNNLENEQPVVHIISKIQENEQESEFDESKSHQKMEDYLEDLDTPIMQDGDNFEDQANLTDKQKTFLSKYQSGNNFEVKTVFKMFIILTKFFRLLKMKEATNPWI